MKRLFLFALCFPFAAFAADAPANNAATNDKPREIVIEAKSINNTTHWMPEKIDITPGEKLHIIAKHELKGGFDFHGLYIPALKIQKQVDRNKPLVFDVTVPKDLKPGEYDVKCHFHASHVGAKMVVPESKDVAKKPKS